MGDPVVYAIAVLLGFGVIRCFQIHSFLSFIFGMILAVTSIAFFVDSEAWYVYKIVFFGTALVTYLFKKESFNRNVASIFKHFTKNELLDLEEMYEKLEPRLDFLISVDTSSYEMLENSVQVKPGFVEVEEYKLFNSFIEDEYMNRKFGLLYNYFLYAWLVIVVVAALNMLVFENETFQPYILGVFGFGFCAILFGGGVKYLKSKDIRLNYNRLIRHIESKNTHLVLEAGRKAKLELKMQEEQKVEQIRLAQEKQAEEERQIQEEENKKTRPEKLENLAKIQQKLNEL